MNHKLFNWLDQEEGSGLVCRTTGLNLSRYETHALWVEAENHLFDVFSFGRWDITELKITDSNRDLVNKVWECVDDAMKGTKYKLEDLCYTCQFFEALYKRLPSECYFAHLMEVVNRKLTKAANVSRYSEIPLHDRDEKKVTEAIKDSFFDAVELMRLRRGIYMERWMAADEEWDVYEDEELPESREVMEKLYERLIDREREFEKKPWLREEAEKEEARTMRSQVAVAIRKGREMLESVAATVAKELKVEEDRRKRIAARIEKREADKARAAAELLEEEEDHYEEEDTDVVSVPEEIEEASAAAPLKTVKTEGKKVSETTRAKKMATAKKPRKAAVKAKAKRASATKNVEAASVPANEPTRSEEWNPNFDLPNEDPLNIPAEGIEEASEPVAELTRSEEFNPQSDSPSEDLPSTTAEGSRPFNFLEFMLERKWKKPPKKVDSKSKKVDPYEKRKQENLRAGLGDLMEVHENVLKEVRKGKTITNVATYWAFQTSDDKENEEESDSLPLLDDQFLVDADSQEAKGDHGVGSTWANHESEEDEENEEHEEEEEDSTFWEKLEREKEEFFANLSEEEKDDYVFRDLGDEDENESEEVNSEDRE